MGNHVGYFILAGLILLSIAFVIYTKREQNSPAGRERIRRMKEEKAAKESAASIKIDSILKDHSKGDTLLVYGVAYWDTLSTTADTVFNKVAGAVLLGGMGTTLTGTTHHFGLLAVSSKNLFLIETRTLSGEVHQASELVPVSDSEKAQCFPLENLHLIAQTNVLIISGALNMKATFPESFIPENAQKPDEIVKVVSRELQVLFNDQSKGL